MLDEFRSTSITWDKATRRIYSPITANASDSNGRKLNIQVVNSGQVENLTGATLHLYWETKDKVHDGLDAFTASDISKGEFEIFYTTGMLSNVGELNATLVLVDSTGKVVSDWFKITVTRGINEGAIESENSFSSLTQALIDISDLEQNYAPRLNDLTAQLQQTDERIAEIITTPVDGSITQQEIINARQGKTSLGENITGIKEQLDDVAYKAENLIPNGKMTDVSQWYAEFSTLSVANQTLSVSGNGANAVPRVGSKPVARTIKAGERILVKIRVRVTNPNCTRISLSIRTGFTDISSPINIEAPVENQWYEVSELVTANASAENVNIYASHRYATASDSVGKVMEMQWGSMLNLSKTFGGNLPSLVDINEMIATLDNQFVDGSAVLTNKDWLFGKIGQKHWGEMKNPINMLVDPLFELGTKHWVVETGTPANIYIDTTKNMDTVNLLRLTKSTAISLSVRAAAPTVVDYKVGRKVGFSAWVYCDSASANENLQFCAVKRSLTDVVKFENIGVTNQLKSGEWSLVTVEFSLDSDIKSIIPYIQSTVASSTANAYIGRMALYLTDKPMVATDLIAMDRIVKGLSDSVANPDGGSPANPTNLEAVVPKKVYTVFNTGTFGYTLPMYLDYLFNQKTDATFANGSDKFLFPDIDDSSVQTASATVPRTVSFKSDWFTIPDKIVTQVATKRDIVNKKAFVLTIGDSVTEGTNAIGEQYWVKAQEFFEKEASDRGMANTVKFLGAQNVVDKNITYNGKTLPIRACAEGRSGWSLHYYLRHSNDDIFNQSHWDKLGLGNGSGTDYVNSNTQKAIVRNATDTESSENIENYFFDNNKMGTNRFSINKWLERYRTLDDSGNRLTLGNGTGTMITADNINNIDVCTPTHITIALGHNDMEVGKGTPEEFQSNIVEIVDAIRAELPNAYIMIVCSIPKVGLWNPAFYPNYIDMPVPGNADKYLGNAEYLVNHFAGINEEESKLFLLPQYFVTPTAEGIRVKEQEDPIGNKYYTMRGSLGSTASHPNANAHANWGYQQYALLKYTMTL